MHPLGDVIFMLCVGKSGLLIMLVVQWVMVGIHFSGWMSGLVGWCFVRFSMLYELSLDREVSVPDMFQVGWGVDGEAWRWRRRLFVWEEEMLGDLMLLLQ
jgi:hypothetical protein